MQCISLDDRVILHGFYSIDKELDAAEILDAVHSHNHKKIIFYDPLEYVPCFQQPFGWGINFVDYFNLLAKKCKVGIEYWTSLHSHKDLVTFKDYNLSVCNWPSYLLYATYHSANHNSSLTLWGNNKKISKLAICVNGKPRDHRSLMLDTIHKYQLQHSMDLSWLVPNGVDTHFPYDFQYFDNRQLVLDVDPGNNPNPEDICVDSVAVPPHTKRNVFALVNETTVDYLDISEKTFMYILAKQPFVIFGAPGVHRMLKRYYGFKLYEDHIDYSFDRIANHKARAEAICMQLKALRNRDFCHLKDEMMPIAEYNYQRYLHIVSNSLFLPEFVKNASWLKDVSHLLGTPHHEIIQNAL